MGNSRKKLWKKCIAFLMVFCMLFSDSHIMTLAEEQSGYTFKFECKLGTETIIIPDVNIELYEEKEVTNSDGETETKTEKVSGTNGTFQLVSGNTYTYNLCLHFVFIILYLIL